MIRVSIAVAGLLLGLACAAGCRSVEPFEDLYDPEIEWRAKAAAALGDVEEPDAVEEAGYALWRAWEDETVPLVRFAIVAAFGRLGTKWAPGVALKAAADDDARVRAAGAATLGRVRSLRHAPHLRRLLNDDPESVVRAAAAVALGDLEDGDAPKRLDDVPVLIRHLDDAPEVSVAAHDALQRITLQPLPRDRATWQAWWEERWGP